MPSTQDDKEIQHQFETGFPVLLNICLFLLLTEAIVFLPFIRISGLLSWALLFSGFQIFVRQTNFSQSPQKKSLQKIVLLSIIAGILVGLGPIIFLYISTVTQLFIMPSVLLVLTACSLPLLGNYLPVVAGFTASAVIAFTVAILGLDNTLPISWPACWIILSLVIIWVGNYCQKRKSF